MRTLRGRASWLAAAWIANGCVLIDYEQQTNAIQDGGIEPFEPDVGLDAQSAADVRSDGSSGNDAASSDASSSEGADGAVDAGATSDGATSDGAAGDAEADAAEGDGAIACATENDCGGCSVLAAAVGDACGSCGVGRYACDGSEALVCANDGTPKSPGNPVLIDDLEDGDEVILSDYGLSGSWYFVEDGTGGTLYPAADTVPTPGNYGALGSSRGLHFYASGFSDWGAGLAVSLSAYGCGYDTSKQTGVEFHVKGTGSMMVSVGTKQTVPVEDHGTCTSNCNDLFSTTIAVPSNWSLRKAAFANLRQAGWGTPATFDPSEVLFVQFTALPNASLDVYIDNLSFY